MPLQTFLNYTNVLQALLIGGGLWWCKEIWERRHEDYRDFRRSPEPARRWVVVLIWFATLVIATLIARFTWNLGLVIYHAFF